MRSAGNFHPEWGYLAPAPSFMRTARIVAVALAIGATAGAAVVVSLVQRPAGNATTSVAARTLVTDAQSVSKQAVAAQTSTAAATDAQTDTQINNTQMNPAGAAAGRTATNAAGNIQARAAVAPASEPVTARLDAPSASSLTVTPSSTLTPSSAPSSALPPPSRRADAAESPELAGAAQTDAMAPARAAPQTLPRVAVAMPAPRPASAPTAEAVPARKVVRKRRAPRYVASHPVPPAPIPEAREDARERWNDERGFGPLLGLFSSRNNSSFYPN